MLLPSSEREWPESLRPLYEGVEGTPTPEALAASARWRESFAQCVGRNPRRVEQALEPRLGLQGLGALSPQRIAALPSVRAVFLLEALDLAFDVASAGCHGL